MDVEVVQLSGTLRWCLQKEDPALIELQHPSGWSVINPLVNVLRVDSRPFPILLSPTVLLLTTDVMSLRIPQGEHGLQIVDEITNLLQRLRNVSKQAAIPRSATGLFLTDMPDVPSISFPKVPAMRGFVRRDLYDTAITVAAIEATGHLAPTFQVPVYDTLLLDAIEAAESQDYRRSILYAAVAVETMANVKLEEEHRRLMTDPSKAARVRSVELATAGSEEKVPEDPVFEYLSSRRAFRLRLHQMAAYVLGRSMLTENPTLYQDALRLYATRNQIVHQGAVVEGPNVLTIDRDGMIRALKCAVKLFEWFGVTDKYTLPSGKFVDVDELLS